MEFNRILFGVFSVLSGYFISFIGINYLRQRFEIQIYEELTGDNYGFGLIPWQLLFTILLAICIYFLIAKINSNKK